MDPKDPVVMDEATGTPPFIPAKVRTIVYISTLVVDVVSFLTLNILGALGIIDRGIAAEVGYYILSAVIMVSVGLAVGYRPTRSGAPTAPPPPGV